MINFITYLILTYSILSPTTEEALELANEIVEVSHVYNQDPILVTALGLRESGLDQSKVHKKSKAFGIMQLHPKWWGKGLDKSDRLANLSRGVEALSHYRKMCGGEIRSVSAYRSGSCHTVGPETFKVMQLTRVWRRKFFQNVVVRIGDIVML